METRDNPGATGSTGSTEEPLLTVSETARRLSISESYLRHLIQRKSIPGIVRIGRAVRFDPSSLRAYRLELLNDAGKR